jgi:hypothetical protein
VKTGDTGKKQVTDRTITYEGKQVTGKTGDGKTGEKTGDALYCTPKVRHAEAKEMGDTYRP